MIVITRNKRGYYVRIISDNGWHVFFKRFEDAKAYRDELLK